MTLPACQECRAILRQYVDAVRALSREISESRLATDPDFAREWHQARTMRTEEDVLVAERVFPQMQFQSASEMHAAVTRKLAHYARTGHRIDWRPSP